jgi:hypothetical protein
VPASVLDAPLTTPAPVAPAPSTQQANPAVPLEAVPKSGDTTAKAPAPATPQPKQ